MLYLNAANVGLMSLADIRQLCAELVQLPEIIVCQLFSLLLGRTSLQRERSGRTDMARKFADNHLVSFMAWLPWTSRELLSTLSPPDQPRHQFWNSIIWEAFLAGINLSSLPCQCCYAKTRHSSWQCLIQLHLSRPRFLKIKELSDF